VSDHDKILLSAGKVGVVSLSVSCPLGIVTS